MLCPGIVRIHGALLMETIEVFDQQLANNHKKAARSYSPLPELHNLGAFSLFPLQYPSVEGYFLSWKN